MITHSTPALIFIRTSIFLLRAVTPLSIANCITLPIFFRTYLSSPFGIAVTSLAVAETLFYSLCYVPLRRRKYRAVAQHPPRLPVSKRRELFLRCRATLFEPVWYIRGWFKEAPLEYIRRDNLREFFAWAMLNDDGWSNVDKPELDWYVEESEKVLKRAEGPDTEIEEGHSDASCLRLTLDPPNILHRPLVWYFIIGIVDTITSVGLRVVCGFTHFQPPARTRPYVFPFRPALSLLGPKTSPAGIKLPYWYRPHRSKTRAPLVVLHGIGVGLWTYLPLFWELIKADDEVGVIAIELLPISFRITRDLPPQKEFLRQINVILQEHGWDEFVLFGHSFGTVLATHIIKDPILSPKMLSVILVDPVSILLHLPDVAFNFTQRKPRLANEHQLYYFASTDALVSSTLSRHFFWSENILWLDDMQSDQTLSVFLSSKDLIVNTKLVWRYLMDADATTVEQMQKTSSREATEQRVWQSAPTRAPGMLRVLWAEGIDHAQVFETKKWRTKLIAEIMHRTARATDSDM